jgi:TPR repeat protein
MAAEQDFPAALSNLGFMHDHGQGVPMDEQKALAYYNKAARKGDEYAKKNRDIIEARIAKQQSNGN